MERNTEKRGKKKGVTGFHVLENECLWMKAGVVNFRLCDNDYDCDSCPFDLGMRKTMNLKSPNRTEKSHPGWVQYLKERYHGASRPCRHAVTGRINAPKICTMDYECHHCPYDQMLDEMDLASLAEEPSYTMVSGYKIADDYYYHMGHSWARFEHGGRVRVGFDDFLVRLFGTMQGVELPPLGASLKQHEVGWTFGRNEHRAAVLSPVTGTVLATNQKALDEPGITNVDPYQSGWLFVLEARFPKTDAKGLYYGNEVFNWIENETQTLISLMGPDYERLSSAGGEAINDLIGHYPELQWGQLVRTFLRTEEK
jgi:glycine cleavage system H lipoate-binding protein